MNEYVKGAIAITIVTLSVIGVACSLSYAFQKEGCSALGLETNRVTKYNWWVGCIVRVNNEYIPVKNWRNYE